MTLQKRCQKLEAELQRYKEELRSEKIMNAAIAHQNSDLEKKVAEASQKYENLLSTGSWEIRKAVRQATTWREEVSGVGKGKKDIEWGMVDVINVHLDREREKSRAYAEQLRQASEEVRLLEEQRQAHRLKIKMLETKLAEYPLHKRCDSLSIDTGRDNDGRLSFDANAANEASKSEKQSVDPSQSLSRPMETRKVNKAEMILAIMGDPLPIHDGQGSSLGRPDLDLKEENDDEDSDDIYGDRLLRVDNFTNEADDEGEQIGHDDKAKVNNLLFTPGPEA
eukprot:jgi/Bigna1/83988/fgenesh1_pg.120_\